ncbi:MAG: hypothetical protein GY757_33040 [bacterium]|nr:hypothetical protein [bacterium]
MKKSYFVLVLLMSLFVLNSCFQNTSPWSANLNVPYLDTTTYNGAAHALAMWSAYDQLWVPEDQIASSILNSNGSVNLWYLELAICDYTTTQGWVAEFPVTDEGQNDAIAAVSQALDSNCPAIMPMLDDTFWLAVGGRGYWNGNGPVADRMKFHNVDEAGEWYSVSEVKLVFYRPINNKFIAFVGDRWHERVGVMNYDDFKMAGGTFTGAPTGYVPNPNTTLY